MCIQLRVIFKKQQKNDTVCGCFRKLEKFLSRFAQFYLRRVKKESLKWFDNAEGTFLVALGGDGCPFAKNESACTFSVRFFLKCCQEDCLQ